MKELALPFSLLIEELVVSLGNVRQTDIWMDRQANIYRKIDRKIDR